MVQNLGHRLVGVSSPADLLLVAASAGLGGGLRRWLGARGAGMAVQAFAAVLIAGMAGGVCGWLHVSSAGQLVAVCPAIVVVPGPHLINGVLDVAAHRLAIRWNRLLYAGTILIAISGGLVLGLAAGGSSLPLTASGVTVPLPVEAHGRPGFHRDRSHPTTATALGVAQDLSTAVLVLGAMALGLIVPHLLRLRACARR